MSGRLSEIDGSRWSLFVFGVLVLCAGATLHGVLPAPAPLMYLGAGAAIFALAMPRLQSFDFGGVLKGELRADDTAGPGAVPSGPRTNEWKLQRFAWLVCGDAQEARELVEEALAEARARRLGAAARGAYELRSLAAMLENVRAHALLRAPRARRRPRPGQTDEVEAVECRPTLEALAELPVRVRMAYLLRCSWLLSIEEVGAILGCPSNEASAAVAEGRQALSALQ